MYENLNRAIEFATQCHTGQVRKLSNTPYILHPMEVAVIIGTMTADEDVLIAGLLHDTVEDCGADPMLIREMFGPRVAALVQSETEEKLATRPAAETWIQRKEESLLLLRYTKDRDVKILWLADKLSNIRSFYREYQANGDGLWRCLNQKDPAKQHWYYQTVAEYLSELRDTAAYREFVTLIEAVFGKGASK